MNDANLTTAFEADGDDFSRSVNPIDRLREKVELLEAECDGYRNEVMAATAAADGLKCTLRDTLKDLETALALVPNHDHPFHFQLRSRIEQIKLLLASRKIPKPVQP